MVKATTVPAERKREQKKKREVGKGIKLSHHHRERKVGHNKKTNRPSAKRKALRVKFKGQKETRRGPLER